MSTAMPQSEAIVVRNLVAAEAPRLCLELDLWQTQP